MTERNIERAVIKAAPTTALMALYLLISFYSSILRRSSKMGMRMYVPEIV